MTEKIKILLSIVSFIAALIIGFIALFIPPAGIIDASVLWFVAQLLIFTSALLHVNMSLDLLNRRAETKKEDDK